MTNPDDLIQRLARNPRDPDLLRQLDQAAWETFHDPWEAPPKRSKEVATRPRKIPPSGEAMEPAVTQPLTVALLRSVLKEIGLRYSLTPDGEFTIPFSYEHDSDRQAWVRISLQGEDKKVLVWRMGSDRRVDAPQFELAFRLCNAWSSAHRWPRPFLDIPLPDEEEEPKPWEPSGAIELDYQMQVPDGLTREGLGLILKNLIGAGWAFWAEARTKYGL